MRKSNLWFGLGYLSAGILFLILYFLVEGRMQAFFGIFAGPGLASGAICLWHYFYWAKPKNRARYEQKLEQEAISLHDERKVMLRDKAGRYAYIAGLAVVFALLMIFYFLDFFRVLEGRSIVFGLFAYLVFQYVIGIVIFQWLSKRH